MAIVSTDPIVIDPVNGIFVDGSDDIRLVPDDSNPLYTGTSVSMIFQWSQVGGSGTRTILRADNQADTAYVELRIDASDDLILDVNGTVTAGIAIADLSATHRAAFAYDGDGNISLSFDGGTVVTNTGASPPSDVNTVWLGNDNGSDQLTGYIQYPIFALARELTAAELEIGSDTSYDFSTCGPATFAVAGWVLATGTWNDFTFWDDDAFWDDSP